jgi:hypothetical protein
MNRRLLGGILTLQLFYAHQELDRKVRAISNCTEFCTCLSLLVITRRIFKLLTGFVQDAPDAPKIREFYRVEELQSPSDPSGLVSSCPPRYIADFLVRAFFNHAEGNYFYVDRTWLNRKMDLVYDAPASLSRRDVPMLCVLFMVLAIGTQYAYLDSDTWRHGGSSSSSIEEVNTFSEDSVGIMLYQQACKLLPDVITISSSESVQACLLIGLYTLPLDPSGLSWVYLGLAMKLAVQNGMHRRYPGQSSDLAMLETRTRVWWTCYMVEK